MNGEKWRQRKTKSGRYSSSEAYMAAIHNSQFSSNISSALKTSMNVNPSPRRCWTAFQEHPIKYNARVLVPLPKAISSAKSIILFVRWTKAPPQLPFGYHRPLRIHTYYIYIYITGEVRNLDNLSQCSGDRDIFRGYSVTGRNNFY